MTNNNSGLPQDCKQLDTIYTHRTDIELLKLTILHLEEKVRELESNQKKSYFFNLTSLIGIICALIGLFANLFVK